MLEIYPQRYNLLSRKDLFRVAADKHLITDPAPWFLYHKARNETAQLYNEKIAEETYLIAREFCAAAIDLLSTLEQKHAGPE